MQGSSHHPNQKPSTTQATHYEALNTYLEYPVVSDRRLFPSPQPTPSTAQDTHCVLLTTYLNYPMVPGAGWFTSLFNFRLCSMNKGERSVNSKQ